MRTPAIFDCDPGHDDAIALILALASDELDIKAVTTVAGNAPLDKTTLNARKVLEVCGRSEVPVAAGAAQPILEIYRPADNVHGKSGMDGPDLPEPRVPAVKEHAVELMAKIVQESDEPVALIVTGPCTNAAIFLLAYPHLAEKLSCISLMGGGYREGNRTAVSEFNIWQDPEAASVVFDSGVPVHIYPLDVTHKALIRCDEFPLFRAQGDNNGDEVAAFVADLLDFYSIYYTGRGKLEGCPMHDACAVAGLVAPELFSYTQCFAQMDLDGRYSRGGIDIDLRPEPRRGWPYNAKVALEVDRPAFLQKLLQACDTLSKRKGATA